MKNKPTIFVLVGFVLVGLLVNSCKKESQDPIQQLFTGGTWQLASVVATYYTGATEDSTVTLDTAAICNGQYFTFYTNNTCTFTNYDCLTQKPAPASWSLTQNQVYLQANVVCKDTTAKGNSTPFAYAEIVNLGQYSLVLNIGDIQPNYSLTQLRVIYQYGFIRIKVNGVD